MNWLRRTVVIALIVVCGLGSGTHGQDGPQVSVRLVGWNMQSDFTPKQKESDPELLREQMGKKNGVHLWGLCEVLNKTALAKFEEGAEEGEGADFASVMGSTGKRDRLAVVYDTTRFDYLGKQELGMIQISSGLRAPLVAHLREKRSGQEFLFMVNHLARGAAQSRLEQAKRLNQWARTQTLPVIAVGDYNFDWDVDKGDDGPPHRDRGYDAMTKDGVFKWARPEKLFRTQSDPKYNSVLDFVFLANAPFTWFAESRILHRDKDEPVKEGENDFSDDKRETDHRPVDAVITFSPAARPRAAPPPGLVPIKPPAAARAADRPTREEILRELDDLERQLRRLRKLVQDLDR